MKTKPIKFIPIARQFVWSLAFRWMCGRSTMVKHSHRTHTRTGHENSSRSRPLEHFLYFFFDFCFGYSASVLFRCGAHKFAFFLFWHVIATSLTRSLNEWHAFTQIDGRSLLFIQVFLTLICARLLGYPHKRKVTTISLILYLFSSEGCKLRCWNIVHNL